jgi:hypothetical protein
VSCLFSPKSFASLDLLGNSRAHHWGFGSLPCLLVGSGTGGKCWDLSSGKRKSPKQFRPSMRIDSTTLLPLKKDPEMEYPKTRTGSSDIRFREGFSY